MAEQGGADGARARLAAANRRAWQMIEETTRVCLEVQESRNRLADALSAVLAANDDAEMGDALARAAAVMETGGYDAGR